MWHQAVGFIGPNIMYHNSEDTNLDTTQGNSMKMKAAGSSSKSLAHIYWTTVQVCLSRTLFSSKSHSGKENVIAEKEKTSTYQNLPNKLMKQNSSFSVWVYMHVHVPQHTAQKSSFMQVNWYLNTNQENISDVKDLQRNLATPSTSTLDITGFS